MRPRPPVVRPVPGATAVFLFAAAYSADFIFCAAILCLYAASLAFLSLLFFLLALSLEAAAFAVPLFLICAEVLLDLVGPLSDLPTVSLGGIIKFLRPLLEALLL